MLRPEAYSSTVYASATLGNDDLTEFDLTTLARGWKTGAQNAQCGFLLKLADESVYRTFYSCEYSTVDYRPYVVLSYNENLTLSYDIKEVFEGDIFALSARTQFEMRYDVDWVSDNPSVATVDENGLVTALKAGKVTITASCTDTGGEPISKSCVVYVRIPDGVYYIQNSLSSYYLDTKDGKIAENTSVQQYTLLSTDNNPEYAVLRQMWIIKHLGDGIYSIRPMHKLDMGLSYDDNSNAVIKGMGDDDIKDENTQYAQWKISYNASLDGYHFTPADNDALYLQPQNATLLNNAIVQVSACQNTAAATWKIGRILTPPQGATLYNCETETVLNYSPTVQIAPNEKWTIDKLNAVAISYSGNNISQTFTWKSNNIDIAECDLLSGEITGVSNGTTSIVGTSVEGETVSIIVTVAGFPVGTYLIKNKQNNCYVEIQSGQSYVYQSNFGTPCNGTSTLVFQSWDIQHLGDGYYSIKSVATSTYLGVADSGELNAAIVLYGEITDRSKWKIDATVSGALKFTAKCGESDDYVLATSTSNTAEGAGLIQGAYVNNTSYGDEWVVAFANSFMNKRAPNTTIYLQVSTDELTMSDEWRIPILDAISVWNSIHPKIHIELTDISPDYTITVTETPPEEYNSTYDSSTKGIMSPVDHADAYIYTANIFIFASAFQEDEGYSYRLKVIAHEIGHLFGLHDNPPVNNHNSIMDYENNIDVSTQFPIFDLENLKFLYNLS